MFTNGWFPLLGLGFAPPTWTADNGVVSIESRYSVPETLDRLEAVVKKQGLTVFARIDFTGDAKKTGLTMEPSQLLLFGNPKAGTPLLVASPTMALDLPLKALAWEDQEAKVWLSYNQPEYLTARHGVPQELVQNIAGITDLAEKAVA